MREPYQELASAIAVQWIRDYLESSKMLVNLAVSYLIGENVRKEQTLLVRFEENKKKFLESRQFFLSAWYEELSETSGQAVMEMLDVKVREYGNQRILNETYKVISKN